MWLLRGRRKSEVRLEKDATRCAFITASRTGDTDNIRSSLAGATDEEVAHLLMPEPAWRGIGALYACCMNGHADITKLLLDARAKVDQLSDDKFSPLHIAASNAHAECVGALLAHGAHVDLASGEGDTPLIMCCGKGDFDSATLLLRATASPDVTNRHGYSALIIACERGFTACARELLEAGASVDFRGFDAERRAPTSPPIFHACAAGHLECVQLCSSYCATRRVAGAARRGEQDGERWAEQLAGHAGQSAVIAFLFRSANWTALHHVEVCTAERVAALLYEGADPHAAPIELTAWPQPNWPPLSFTADEMAEFRETGENTPSPLELARRLPEADARRAMMEIAVGPWSPDAHRTFPHAARAVAVHLLLPLHQLCVQRLVNGPPPGWFAAAILSRLVTRDSKAA